MSGCADLRVTQSSFQGDMARSREDRLAMAKGVARIIQTNSNTWTSGDKFRREIEDQENSTALRKKLFQFATEVELSRPTDKREKRAIDQDHEDARMLKELIRFHSFDQIALDESSWKVINPIEVYGGFGKTEFVLVRDDGGNYNIKSVAFDPSEVVAAGVNSALSVMRIMATAYGIPPIPVSGPAHKPGAASPVSALTTPNLSSYVRFTEQTVQELDISAKQLKMAIDTVEKGVANDNAASTNPALESVKAALHRYIRVTGVASRNVNGLQGLARLLPENDPQERLAAQFNVGSLSSRQIVAVYWTYEEGLANDQEKQVVAGVLSPLVTFTNLNPVRIPGMNAGVVSGALAEINTGRVLATAVSGTRQDLTDLGEAWRQLSILQNAYGESYRLAKSVVDGFSGLTATNADQVALNWKNAMEFVKTHSAGQLGGHMEDLAKYKGVINKLGDTTSAQTATTLHGGINSQLEKIKRVAELVEERKDKAVLDSTQAEDLKTKLATIGFPAAPLSAVSLSNAPALKQMRDISE